MPKKPPTEAPPLTYNPFVSLAATRDALPSGPAPPPKPTPAPSAPLRAVIRFARKGHGGKDVTLVEKLALPPAELERWLKELKAALGCGGVQDGENLLLQGDQRARLPALLTQAGVRKVTVG